FCAGVPYSNFAPDSWAANARNALDAARCVVSLVCQAWIALRVGSERWDASMLKASDNAWLPGWVFWAARRSLTRAMEVFSRPNCPPQTAATMSTSSWLGELSNQV